MTGLPINIDELIHGRTVEWERVEFKKGWNPIKVLHTACAFANDFNNWGGGYIVLGIEPNDGRLVLPPIGISKTDVDRIQKELLGLCHRLKPNYFPIVEPVVFQGKGIIVIWVPGGQNRPYQAPEGLGSRVIYQYYIRRFSSTVIARTDERTELLSMAGTIPFDDQINHNAKLNDLNITLIKSHLAEIKSDLLSQVDEMSFKELVGKMGLIDGPVEYVKPRNIGLLFFNHDPDRFFRGAHIDVLSSMFLVINSCSFSMNFLLMPLSYFLT